VNLPEAAILTDLAFCEHLVMIIRSHRRMALGQVRDFRAPRLPFCSSPLSASWRGNLPRAVRDGGDQGEGKSRTVWQSQLAASADPL